MAFGLVLSTLNMLASFVLTLYFLNKENVFYLVASLVSFVSWLAVASAVYDLSEMKQQLAAIHKALLPPLPAEKPEPKS